MAEVVEYRVGKTVDETNLLVEFGLFNEEQARELLAKREKFEYILRRRNRTKLDYLKYIRFEVNVLESIENYKKKVIRDYYKQKKSDDKLEELERKILLLQAKKLNDVIRSRCSHVSFLFRKLTTSFQFDKKLWLAYIDFAKGRSWNTRVTALYWRLLRVSSDDEDIWIAAAEHEINVNKAYDTARGLYLRALRHHPKSSKVWVEYFKMELKFMEVVDQRARIVFKITQNIDDAKKDEDIWAEKEETVLEGQIKDDSEDERKSETKDGENELPNIKPIDEDDTIISGHLPKVIYENASGALVVEEDYQTFLTLILIHILSSTTESKGQLSINQHIRQDIAKKFEDGDKRVTRELVESCDNLDRLKEQFANLGHGKQSSAKRMKREHSKMAQLYECYNKSGLEGARKLFHNLERSVKNQTLSLYVGMIQIETWQLPKDKSEGQLNRIRSIYDKALLKFGKVQPKLWYEYLQFEHKTSKRLEDFERVNRLYSRAQATLEPSKVNRVIEKYTLLQVNSSKADIEFSDYSDLED